MGRRYYLICYVMTYKKCSNVIAQLTGWRLNESGRVYSLYNI